MMRMPSLLVVVLLLTAGAVVQGPGPAQAQVGAGNRANGLNYQPTPNEVVPREKAAGIKPPASRRDANGHALESIDKKLLRQEGKSTDSVPKLGNAQ